MKKSLLIVAVGIMVTIGGVFAISPYFINTTVDEALPSTTVQSIMEEKVMMEEKTIQTYIGAFVGVGDAIHDAQGIAETISLEDGSQVLRLEDFKVTNGPDLYVYLATDNRASEFVSLGELKANNGNQNYEIPDDTDLKKYNKVLIWCKTFGVLFGNADLTSQ
jgi:hypothetical protein